MTVRILQGDCRDVLPTLPADSVHCVVTSPPYYALRDYGVAGQLGLEATPDAYIGEMVAVFREVRRVMRPDATLWLNVGDSYSGGGGYAPDAPSNIAGSKQSTNVGSVRRDAVRGMPSKNLLMMPARLALALQADGWWVRSDIIWAKPNPMPESVTDRPTSAHEHIYLLTKSSRYYYDADAVREDLTGHRDNTIELHRPGNLKLDERLRAQANHDWRMNASGRNLRNVWTLATEAFPGSHYATFPTELVSRCIRAGSKVGDTVLDPFSGAGTTALVADRLGRNAIGIELNAEYVAMSEARISGDCPLFVDYGDAVASDSAAIPEPPEDERMADLFAYAAD